MLTFAEERLEELLSGILQNQSSPKTLAYFRLSSPAIIQDLENFATASNIKKRPLLEQVLDLFQQLNLHMAEQERSCPTWGDFFAPSKAISVNSSQVTKATRSALQIHSPIEISVVFGGKFSRNPASISEQLVSKLVLRSQTVYTVSRSTCKESDLPTNVKHISKKNLDIVDDSSDTGSNVGTDEFYDVMSMAKEEWLKSSDDQHSTNLPTKKMLVLYFTLGQHKGVNPFVRNLNSAENFHRALLKLLSCPIFVRSTSSETNTHDRDWRVVVTGTDATLPSTHQPFKMTMSMKKNDVAVPTVFTVPTYKIGTNNFVYAMSKLGQFYWIANAVARLLVLQKDDKKRHEYLKIARKTEDTFRRIRNHVKDAGEDGAYKGTDTGEKNGTIGNSISMEELDSISFKMSALVEEVCLRDHFRIAEQISICYTPLHAKPWTQDAIRHTTTTGSTRKTNTTTLTSSVSSTTVTTTISSQGSSSFEQQEQKYQEQEEEQRRKAFILEQIVKRFKNAISIESAASSHLQEKY